jgi:hypothetical protein
LSLSRRVHKCPAAPFPLHARSRGTRKSRMVLGPGINLMLSPDGASSQERQESHAAHRETWALPERAASETFCSRPDVLRNFLTVGASWFPAICPSRGFCPSCFCPCRSPFIDCHLKDRMNASCLTSSGQKKRTVRSLSFK